MSPKNANRSKYVNTYSSAVQDAKSGQYVVAKNKASSFSVSSGDSSLKASVSASKPFKK